ncbi:hypothetical protein GQ54DRAFT_294721 [Martensiomyces pterosporus]|nr:hypothetical protein GQ54DRAFT_294721 [Martensiomyces pterosporus]
MSEHDNKPPAQQPQSTPKLPQNAKRPLVPQQAASAAAPSSPLAIQEGSGGLQLRGRQHMHMQNSSPSCTSASQTGAALLAPPGDAGALSFNSRKSIGSTTASGGSSLARATGLSIQGNELPRHARSASPLSGSRQQTQQQQQQQQRSGWLPAKDNAEDSDSTTTSSYKQRRVLERSEVARRLKRHLVTRPASGLGHDGSIGESDANGDNHGLLSRSFNSVAPALAGIQHRQSIGVMADDGGYAGDDNEDYDSNSLVMPGDPSAHDETVDPLTLPSGDITHQIYRWQGKNDQASLMAAHSVGCDTAKAAMVVGLPGPDSAASDRRNSAALSMVMGGGGRGGGRRRSFSGWDSDSEWGLGFTHGQINAPGGFRRQFVQERAVREGRQYPGFMADSFVDFIALYGHFAGGNYLSDEDEEFFESIQHQDEQQGQQAAAAAADAGSTDGDRDEGPADERTPLRRSASSLHATASNRKAFFLIIKAFVGTGVLVLPRAFYNGGLLTSCVMMVAVAWYAWHCILLLAEVYLKVGGSYSDIGLRLYGRWMQYAVTGSIVLAQIGGCCAYTIFVAQNWRNVFNTLTGCQMNLPTDFWVLIQLLVLIPLALIRQIRYFAPVALVANALIITSLAYLLGFDTWSIASRGPAPFVNYNPLRFPLLVGTAVYSFEGVTLVIPILDSLKEKRDFGKVLTLAITLCLALFLCVGSLSYLTFGDRVEAVVLLNLPNESSWTILVQLFYSVAILFSMPLQLFPAVKIVEAMAFTRSGREHKSIKWQKNLFRTLTVMLIALIAIFGADQLDNVVSLVGSFCLVPLSFIYPASMHLKAVARSRWTCAKDGALIAVGLVALVYVTYISIATWGTSDPPLDICASGP